MPEFHVRLAVFEGPLDLLLHLLQKEKLDIWDVSCAQITAAYLEYLSSIDEVDLEAAGDYLVMAAHLVRIKAKRLLPPQPHDVEQDEEDEKVSAEELARRLHEYRTFKSLSGHLKERKAAWSRVLPRWESGAQPPKVEFVWPNPVGPATPHDLAHALEELLRAQERRMQPLQLTVRQANVSRKMAELRTLLVEQESFGFWEVLYAQPDVLELITTFLGILELIRLGEASAAQSSPFGEIYIMTTRVMTHE